MAGVRARRSINGAFGRPGTRVRGVAHRSHARGMLPLRSLRPRPRVDLGATVYFTANPKVLVARKKPAHRAALHAETSRQFGRTEAERGEERVAKEVSRVRGHKERIVTRCGRRNSISARSRDHVTVRPGTRPLRRRQQADGPSASPPSRTPTSHSFAGSHWALAAVHETVARLPQRAPEPCNPRNRRSASSSAASSFAGRTPYTRRILRLSMERR